MTPDAPHSLRIALVAHDNKKRDLVEWARYNLAFLARHELVATGTTGTLLERELGLPVARLQSGPLGGDQQLGALIAEGKVDFFVFFWDPLEPQPHDPDVKALLRLAVVWNIPTACNRATADYMVSSPLTESSYERAQPDYHAYLGRALQTDAPAEAPDVVPVAPDAVPEAPDAVPVALDVAPEAPATRIER